MKEKGRRKRRKSKQDQSEKWPLESLSAVDQRRQAGQKKGLLSMLGWKVNENAVESIYQTGRQEVKTRKQGRAKCIPLGIARDSVYLTGHSLKTVYRVLKGPAACSAARSIPSRLASLDHSRPVVLPTCSRFLG